MRKCPKDGKTMKILFNQKDSTTFVCPKCNYIVEEMKQKPMPKIMEDYSVEHITDEVILTISALKETNADLNETCLAVVEEIVKRMDAEEKEYIIARFKAMIDAIAKIQENIDEL
jgi:5'-3' exonuclease